MAEAVVQVHRTRVDWQRLRRSGLVDPFTSAEGAARHLLGAQAQIPVAGAIALANRTTGYDLAGIEAERLEARSLVRFWGQRNTVHLYGSSDWPLLHDALADSLTVMEQKLEKAGLYDELLRVSEQARSRLAAGEVLTYKDVRSPKLEEGQDTWVVSYAIFMKLVRAGVACHGPDQGSQSGFVHREHWLPALEWTPPGAGPARAEIARRYFAAYGPAEPRDLAFWFGTTVRQAKRWIADCGDALTTVQVDGREMLAATESLEELAAPVPVRSRWPVHLLYRFDPLLLATKDKSWLIDEAHYKKVWKAAAHVAPVVLAGGRIVGTWRYDRKGGGLKVSVESFAPLPKTAVQAIRGRARRLARFLGLKLTAVEIADPT
jgi:hypothetical protein